MQDAAKLAAVAVESAAAVAPVAKAADYEILAGPFEVAGSRSDAYITKSPAGDSYLEDRPRSGSRTKRVPLAAVVAVFPQITQAPAAAVEKPAPGKKA